MAWPMANDYFEAMQSPALSIFDQELKGGIPDSDRYGLPRVISGNFAVVFRMKCASKEYAVRCFLNNIPDQQERYEAISRHLEKNKLSYMVDFKYLEKGIRVKGNWYPILKMEWVQGESLNEYIVKNLNSPQRLKKLSQEWIKMCEKLQAAGIAHGDFQHGNILVSHDSIKLIDYDGMYVPDFSGKSSHELGHPNYQHPARCAKDFGLHIDNFSAWVIYFSMLALSIDPRLWGKLGLNEERLLFTRNDFLMPGESSGFNLLAGHGDGTIRMYAGIVRDFCKMAIHDIPLLNEAAVQAACTSWKSADQPGALPGWLLHNKKLENTAPKKNPVNLTAKPQGEAARPARKLEAKDLRREDRHPEQGNLPEWVSHNLKIPEGPGDKKKESAIVDSQVTRSQTSQGTISQRAASTGKAICPRCRKNLANRSGSMDMIEDIVRLTFSGICPHCRYKLSFRERLKMILGGF